MEKKIEERMKTHIPLVAKNVKEWETIIEKMIKENGHCKIALGDARSGGTEGIWATPATPTDKKLIDDNSSRDDIVVVYLLNTPLGSGFWGMPYLAITDGSNRPKGVPFVGMIKHIEKECDPLWALCVAERKRQREEEEAKMSTVQEVSQSTAKPN